MDQDVKKYFVYLIAAIVVVGLLNFGALQMLKTQTNGKLNTVENNLANQISSVDATVHDVKRNITMENRVQDAQIDNIQKDTNKAIITLTSIVSEIQEESSAQLEKLQQDLASVSANSKDFSAIVEQVLPGVVSVQTDVGLGSGAIISKDGYIVTNQHVIAGANAMRIVKANGDAFSARIVGVNAGKDVAVLKISGTHEELWFAAKNTIRVGEKVIALGSPGGLDFTVTQGIVSAVGREFNGNTYVQTDVPINPGNSGGPLINTDGRIIGLNNFKIAGFDGVGFAIESDTVESIADAFIQADQAAQSS
ncbi:MAG: trypsin-like peptidase domain-containing protein [Nanoarchaeota archaeon]|nr:trypsin-like peptidase domain-containing protein [Nanoarchaeota archaeon]